MCSVRLELGKDAPFCYEIGWSVDNLLYHITQTNVLFVTKPEVQPV